jgi:hypothetical protein
MKTYLTRHQFEAMMSYLEEAGSLDPIQHLNNEGIFVSRSDHKDNVDYQDVRSMAAELGEHIALRFSAKSDVRYAYPWLCAEDADEVAADAAMNFDYEYRIDVIEAAMRANSLSIDPPEGWFEWRNEHSDTVWTTWTQEDAVAAAKNGWCLIDPTGTPEIHDYCATWGSAARAGSIVDESAARFRKTGAPRATERAASKAVALINDWADRQPTDVVMADGSTRELKLAHEVGKSAEEVDQARDDNPFHPESPEGRAFDRGEDVS